jgi:hypothetical protein
MNVHKSVKPKQKFYYLFFSRKRSFVCLQPVDVLLRSHVAGDDQDCQMVCFQTKNPNSGKFRWALDW